MESILPTIKNGYLTCPLCGSNYVSVNDAHVDASHTVRLSLYCKSCGCHPGLVIENKGERVSLAWQRMVPRDAVDLLEEASWPLDD